MASRARQGKINDEQKGSGSTGEEWTKGQSRANGELKLCWINEKKLEIE